jgi:hypothetical protein
MIQSEKRWPGAGVRDKRCEHSRFGVSSDLIVVDPMAVPDLLAELDQNSGRSPTESPKIGAGRGTQGGEQACTGESIGPIGRLCRGRSRDCGGALTRGGRGEPEASDGHLARNVWIAGTGTGIGMATVLVLGRAGHTVFATMRNPIGAPEQAQTAAKERLPIHVSVMDVDSDASVTEAIGAITEANGPLDVLVSWDEPEVDGTAVELIRNYYEEDPGYEEWEVHARAADTGRLQTVARPNPPDPETASRSPWLWWTLIRSRRCR